VTFTAGMIPGVSSNTWELNHNWDTHQVAALLEFRSCWGKTLFISLPPEITKALEAAAVVPVDIDPISAFPEPMR